MIKIYWTVLILILILVLFQMTASDHVRVVLDQVQTKLTGTYLCEVTVTPTFFALAESANMTIIGEINLF